MANKKPISIKIALGLSILIMWSNCFGLVRLLWSFPPLLKHNIPTILIAKLVVDGVINIAAIALVLTVWRWLLRRDPWGRWGLVALIILSIGWEARREWSTMPINETHDFQLGWHAASIMFCLALLLLALRIIFSSAVKGYFASPPNSALNRYEQANLPPAG